MTNEFDNEPYLVAGMFADSEVVVVNEAIPGPRGPKGEPGKDAGSLAAVSEAHYQNVVSDTWTFVYDLEYIPTVTVVDSAGSTVEGELRYLPNHVIEIKFAVPFSGTAYLS
jgi:hypothetical protein